MRYLPLFVVAVLSGSLVAADDLNVLPEIKKDGKAAPANKLLHTQLLAQCDTHFAFRKAEIEKLKTPDDVAKRQRELRAKFITAIGGIPAKTPLNAKTVGTLKRDGYTIEKVIYESQPEHHVTANLYLPAGKGPFPGVIMPIGHSANGKAAEYMQRGALILAKNGIVALVYDPIGQGERSQLLDKLGNPAIKGTTSEHTMCGIGSLLVGRSTASYRIWDGIRSLDYLESRPEIDAKRLGCTGCSGGGTLTSYLMALDDRIVAAAPSCYITSLERLFNTIGPQDAEQNITGQVAFGLDHADYITLHAPKPTLILASTRDFFDIQGTWTSYREAKRIYTLLGTPERLDIIEADATHGFPKSHREAMTRFMCRWLKGEDKAIPEENWPIEKDADLRCTRTGQVLDDLRGKSVFDLNAIATTEFAKQRAAKTLKPEEFRAEVAKLIDVNEFSVGAGVSRYSRIDRKTYNIHRTVYTTRDGMRLPELIFEPNNAGTVGLPVIYLHDAGKANLVALEEIESLVKKRRRVVAVDIRGFGETATSTAKPGAFGNEFKESFLSLHLNRPLTGQRTNDILSVVREVVGKDGGEVIAYGNTVPAALHAAALDTRVSVLTLDGGLVSWDSVIRNPISHNQLVHAVPGALKVYDLPELAASVAPRPLTIRNPVDATGKPLTKDAAELAYKVVRDAYKRANAETQFTLIVDAK
jgi:dienelactone hydrolase